MLLQSSREGHDRLFHRCTTEAPFSVFFKRTYRQEENITVLIETIKNFTNPFTEKGEKLCNLVTMAVMPDTVRSYLYRQSSIGSKLFDEFVTNHIKTPPVNLWAPLKKTNLNGWNSTTMIGKLNIDQKVVKLKDDRGPFARLLLVSKSRPNINLKWAVGNQELLVVPMSLFAIDGHILHCAMNSTLMTVLTSLVQKGPDDSKENSIQ